MTRVYTIFNPYFVVGIFHSFSAHMETCISYLISEVTITIPATITTNAAMHKTRWRFPNALEEPSMA